MSKLIENAINFRDNVPAKYMAIFQKLAQIQSPEVLFITCADSRIIPNLLSSSEPGEIFVIRNVGNLIPSYKVEQFENKSSESAALEFAILELNITNIVICGHSNCGAIKALVNQNADLSIGLKNWLENGSESLNRYLTGEIIDPDLMPHDQISQLNVLQQIEHIKSYPFVNKVLNKKTLTIHAWWFDISKTEILVFSSDEKRFVNIEKYYKKV